MRCVPFLLKSFAFVIKLSFDRSLPNVYILYIHCIDTATLTSPVQDKIVCNVKLPVPVNTYDSITIELGSVMTHSAPKKPPVKKQGKKDSQLIIRINAQERDDFVALCESLDTSAAREIRRFIRAFHKEHE